MIKGECNVQKKLENPGKCYFQRGKGSKYFNDDLQSCEAIVSCTDPATVQVVMVRAPAYSRASAVTLRRLDSTPERQAMPPCSSPHLHHQPTLTTLPPAPPTWQLSHGEKIKQQSVLWFHSLFVLFLFLHSNQFPLPPFFPVPSPPHSLSTPPHPSQSSSSVSHQIR